MSSRSFRCECRPILTPEPRWPSTSRHGNTLSSVAAPGAKRRGVTDHGFARAEELLKALRPRNPLWEGEAQRWLFRGHADAEWDLQPTGIRDLEAYQKVGVALAQASRGQAPWSQRAQLQTDMLARSASA